MTCINNAARGTWNSAEEIEENIEKTLSRRLSLASPALAAVTRAGRFVGQISRTDVLEALSAQWR